MREGYDIYQLENGVTIDIPKFDETKEMEQLHDYNQFIDILVNIILKYINEIMDRPIVKKAS